MAYAPDDVVQLSLCRCRRPGRPFPQDIDPMRAAEYQESAIRAMNWAEAEYQEGLHVEIDNARNLAAAELYRLDRSR
jgi:hypothetical protein